MLEDQASPRNLCQDLRHLLAVCRPAQAAVDRLPGTFQSAHHALVLLQPDPLRETQWERDFDGTAYARLIPGTADAAKPEIDARAEEALQPLLQRLHEKNFLRSAALVGDGGLAVALAQAGAEKGLGCCVEMGSTEAESALDAYFGEHPARALLTCIPSAHLALTNAIERSGLFAAAAIGRVMESELVLLWEQEVFLRCTLASLRA